MQLTEAHGNIPLTRHSCDEDFLSTCCSRQWLTDAIGSVPASCIDGRWPQELFPRSAGATIGLWAARNVAAQDQVPLFDTIALLTGGGCEVGGHTGPLHGVDAKSSSGCGAADHLPEILADITSPAVREMVSAWGFDTDHLDAQMHTRALALIEAEFSGAELVTSLRAAPNSHVPRLQGNHRESAVIVNLRAGTTIDAEALAQWSPDHPEAFVVDAWSFASAANLLADGDPALSRRIEVALAAFNAAALLCLVGTDFPLEVIHA